MKKLLIIAVCAVFALAANAQRPLDKKVSFSVGGGLNICGIAGDVDANSGVGFNAGAGVDFNIARNFGINSGLYLTLKGGSKTYTRINPQVVTADELSISSYYFQIPVLASGRIHLGNNVRWDINAGPYIAVGVFGKMKAKVSAAVKDEILYGETSYDTFGSAKKQLKRFDWGIAVGTKFNFRRWCIGIQYEHGLYDISNDNSKIRNWNVNTSAAFLF